MDTAAENLQHSAAKIKERLIETSKLIEDYKKKRAQVVEL